MAHDTIRYAGDGARTEGCAAGSSVHLLGDADVAGGLVPLVGQSRPARSPDQIALDTANSPLIQEWAATMARQTIETNRQFIDGMAASRRWQAQLRQDCLALRRGGRS